DVGGHLRPPIWASGCHRSLGRIQAPVRSLLARAKKWLSFSTHQMEGCRWRPRVRDVITAGEEEPRGAARRIRVMATRVRGHERRGAGRSPVPRTQWAAVATTSRATENAVQTSREWLS